MPRPAGAQFFRGHSRARRWDRHRSPNCGRSVFGSALVPQFGMRSRARSSASASCPAGSAGSADASGLTTGTGAFDRVVGEARSPRALRYVDIAGPHGHAGNDLRPRPSKLARMAIR
jgi:hypothetical protein